MMAPPREKPKICAACGTPIHGVPIAGQPGRFLHVSCLFSEKDVMRRPPNPAPSRASDAPPAAP